MGLGRDRSRPRQGGILPAGRAEGADGVEHPLLDLAPDSGRPERVVAGPPQRGDGLFCGRERGREVAVEAHSLERVVVASGSVDVAAEPAGLQVRVRVADLPVVAGGEVRLVGVRVPDRGEDGELALVVQRVERGRGRMPPEPRVFREDETGVGQRKLRPQPPIVRVTVRKQKRQRVGPAIHEDRDEDRVRPACCQGLGDAVVEGAWRECAPAVDGEGEAHRPSEEAAAVEAGARGNGHSRARSRASRTPPARRLSASARNARTRYSSRS